MSQPAAPDSPCLFSPAIDCFIVANVGWPFLLIIDLVGGLATHESLLFWQVFFVTTPHRWVTLVVVATDRRRTEGRVRALVAVAIGSIVVAGGLLVGTGTLLCLGAIDYAWNAWHFASQHHGVLRLYQRRAGLRTTATLATLEKIVFRGLLLFVIARVAGVGWLVGPFAGTEMVRHFDLLAAIPAAALLAHEWIRWWQQPGKRQAAAKSRPRSFPAAAIYLTSAIGLYLAMLAAAHAERRKLILALALASAVFHAAEYLAVVNWSQASSGTASGAGSRPRPQLLLLNGSGQLLTFALVLGLGNYLVSRVSFDTWIAVNLVVAFCHYGFDGIIWRSRPTIGLAAEG